MTTITEMTSRKQQEKQINKKTKMGRKTTKWGIKEFALEMTWTRVRRTNLNRETGSLLIAVENNTININYAGCGSILWTIFLKSFVFQSD